MFLSILEIHFILKCHARQSQIQLQDKASVMAMRTLLHNCHFDRHFALI